MMRFKIWLQNENLVGRGNGPDFEPIDQEKLGKEIVRRGAGAFPAYSDKLPRPRKTPTTDYLDQRFAKGMKKYMKSI